MSVWFMDALMLHWQDQVVATGTVWLADPKIFTVWLFRENFLILLHVNHSRALQVGCYSQLLAPLDPQSHYPQYVWGMELNHLTPKLIVLWPNAHRTKSQFPSMEQTHPTLPSCKSLRPMALNSLLVSKHALHVCMYWDLCVFELWCWRRLLKVPWTARRSNHSILKEINPAYSLEELCWSSITLGTWGEELTHWKRSWYWEILRARGEEGSRGDGWMESPNQWIWVWANSGR